MPQPVLDVLDGGLQTTIQDLGRPGHRHSGVPIGGACDPISLAIANRLAGNPGAAAALECTLLGPTLLALDDVLVALAGADLGAVADPGAHRIRPGDRRRLRRGDRLRLTGPLGEGCRAYLAIDGGFDAPVVLGSRSTALPGGFGGHGGRPLRQGDRLLRGAREAGPADTASVAMPGTVAPMAEVNYPALAGSIRVLPPPDGRTTAGPDRYAALLDGSWTVTPASDRRGLRLAGPPLPFVADADHASQPMVPGAIQLTPAGAPIVLLQDAGTTGGYPVIGVVISADLRLAGQARPGDSMRFVATDLEAAHAAAIATALALAQLDATLSR